MPRKRSGLVEIRIRVEPDLHNRIKAAAERNDRTLSAEIVAALQRLFPLRLAATET
jgi:predicted HicB family RNase H-like nuclease